mmetsp:Transcript_18122/g.20912  ORF Transcript_18122/g.20912 Transcript_18122/m.20912 type:complete len:359 (-) Transcript_18122:259-1335(-)
MKTKKAKRRVVNNSENGTGSFNITGYSSFENKKASSSSFLKGGGSFSDCGRCSHVFKRYEKLGRIGEGTYGIVYKARDKIRKDFVALKRCLPHHESSDGFPLTTLREVSTLKQCHDKHDNIIQLREIAVSSSRSGVFLVFEYCPHDLAKILDRQYSARKKSPFTGSQVKRLVYQLLSALEFLHHHRKIVHRDLKLSNMLYSKKGNLKLADFGLSRSISTKMTPGVVSLWYRPPELLLGNKKNNYGSEVDMWGAGCAMAELLLGCPLWKGTTELEQLQKIVDILGTPPPGLIQNPILNIANKKRNQLWDKFENLQGLTLLSSLVQYDPTLRPTASDALKSNYFRTEPLPSKTMPSFSSI